MREAGGEAGCGRLVGARQLQRMGEVADVGLGQPEVGQRPQHRVAGRGSRARPVRAAGVVGVLAVGHGGEPVTRDDLIGDPGEQLVLAVEAPVRTIGSVCRVVTLVGRHLHDGDPDECGDVVGAGPLVRGQAGRDSEDRHDALGAEHPDGEGEQQRGVHATGERDTEPLDTGEEPGKIPHHLLEAGSGSGVALSHVLDCAAVSRSSPSGGHRC